VLPIPASARGTLAAVTATIDPANLVAETKETNNSNRAAPKIASG
jgi:hypothetical protein